MLDFKRDDGKFEGRASAVRCVIKSARRDEVCDVANHKHIAGFGIGKDCRIDPRIRARHHHDLWPLLKRKLLEQSPFWDIGFLLKGQEACN